VGNWKEIAKSLAGIGSIKIGTPNVGSGEFLECFDRRKREKLREKSEFSIEIDWAADDTVNAESPAGTGFE
jgi:hypothetical protein